MYVYTHVVHQICCLKCLTEYSQFLSVFHAHVDSVNGSIAILRQEHPPATLCGLNIVIHITQCPVGPCTELAAQQAPCMKNTHTRRRTRQGNAIIATRPKQARPIVQGKTQRGEPKQQMSSKTQAARIVRKGAAPTQMSRVFSSIVCKLTETEDQKLKQGAAQECDWLR